jgi:hypothetical protein
MHPPAPIPQETPETRLQSIKNWTAIIHKNIADKGSDTVIAATSNAIGRTIIQVVGVACESPQYESLIVKGAILGEQWMGGIPPETKKIIEDGLKAIQKAVTYNPDKRS